MLTCLMSPEDPGCKCCLFTANCPSFQCFHHSQWIPNGNKTLTSPRFFQILNYLELFSKSCIYIKLVKRPYHCQAVICLGFLSTIHNEIVNPLPRAWSGHWPLGLVRPRQKPQLWIFKYKAVAIFYVTSFNRGPGAGL